MRRIIFILAIFLVIFLMPILKVDAVSPTAPIKILLVPGHDNQIWGAEYKNIKEADMNLILATKIYDLLSKDKRFEVWITRDASGYTKEFSDYFSLHQQDIISFEKNSKKTLQDQINNGSFVKKVQIIHNKASEDTAIRLYGINKWADDNKIDAVIHVHFDDYPRKNMQTAGKYKGFTIFIPEKQMINFKESTKLAKSVFSQLLQKYASSNFKSELGGLAPDQTLIALGSNNTLIESVRSILIEYGYIYRFANSTMRHQAYINMANLTVKGIVNYFFGK